MITKNTLAKYRDCKLDIAEVKWFRNDLTHKCMMRARSNTIDLKWREKEEADKLCPLCKNAVETLIHFVLECSALQDIRQECIILQNPKNEEYTENLYYVLLLKNCDHYSEEYYINLLDRLYKAREKLIKLTSTSTPV